MIYTYTTKSMLAEVSRSAFEGLVYEFTSPVDQARVCFVHKVYTFLHAWVYPIISWQQFGTIGIIQRADTHEMKYMSSIIGFEVEVGWGGTASSPSPRHGPRCKCTSGGTSTSAPLRTSEYMLGATNACTVGCSGVSLTGWKGTKRTANGPVATGTREGPIG